MKTGTFILFRNKYDYAIIWEVIGNYIGATNQDSVIELKPINISSSPDGNQFINPQLLEILIESGAVVKF